MKQIVGTDAREPRDGVTTVELDPGQERYFIGIMPPQ